MSGRRAMAPIGRAAIVRHAMLAIGREGTVRVGLTAVTGRAVASVARSVARRDVAKGE